MSLIRKHVAVLQAWACLDLVLILTLSIYKQLLSTFLWWFTEDGIMFINCHQRDVVIINDVLRVLEVIMSAYKVSDGRNLKRTELVGKNDVKDLSRSFIVLRQASFT